MTQPLFIGPYELGLQLNMEPFMITEKAFPTLNNAFVFRGRVEKKFGYTSLGRLQRNLTTASLGNSGASPWTFNIYTLLSISGEPAAAILPRSVIIAIGTLTLTDQGNGTFAQTGVITGATQANPCKITSANHNLLTGFTVTINNVGGMTQLNGNTYTITRVDANNFTLNGVNSTAFGAYTSGGTWISVNTTNFGVINYATGDVTITDALGSGVSSTITFSYFPSLPVMALSLRELTTINFFQTVAFDTKYAYSYSAGAWGELAPGTVWTGSDSQFFWTTNFGVSASNNDLFWATNFNNPIRYYDGATWTDFAPYTLATGGNDTMDEALVMVPYKDRFLAFNTIETVGRVPGFVFPQRVRWCQNASPDSSIPIQQTTAWLTDVVGRGGYVDAPTSEQIVTVGFVKDTLVVYFERSAWQLVYTSNEVLPFIWQRINAELGAQSTFSEVTFDNALIAWGTTGIHNCNGVKAERMDAIIPDAAFRVNFGNDGTQRIYGARDYRYELAYFTYPDLENVPPLAQSGFRFPNRVLVYNYRNDTYSYFRENFTCYGYFQLGNPVLWEDLVAGTAYAPWSAWQSPWNSAFVEAQVPDVCAGTQQGFVVVMDDETGANAPTLFVQGFTFTGTVPMQIGTITSPNHNLQIGEFVYFTGDVAGVGINNLIFKVQSVPTANTFTIIGGDPGFSGTYIGGAIIQLLSNTEITTKMFNPFWAVGKRHRLRKCEFLFPKTADGAVTVDIFVDTADYSVTDPMTNPSVLGDNAVSTAPEPNIPNQLQQSFIWHHTYPMVDGDTFQIQISLSDAQMLSMDKSQPSDAIEDVALHGMVLYFEPAEQFL